MALSLPGVRFSHVVISGGVALACLAWASGFGFGFFFGAPGQGGDRPPASTLDGSSRDSAKADELNRHQQGFFIPNLGQWNHAARFVHRSGPMTVFLQERGWVLDLVERSAKVEDDAMLRHPIDHREMTSGMPPENGRRAVATRGVALQMTFEGDARVPKAIGEQKLPSYHNYFLGRDENLWRAGVPLYTSVRYESLYPGIDLRLRESEGRPEYDLLLEPGADLAQVVVRVEGARGMSIASDGTLVIDTVLGPLTQPVPKTWQVDHTGEKREVDCDFVLLGAGRFGFSAPDWREGSRLTIDPALLWSSFLEGDGDQWTREVFVDNGLATVVGTTGSRNFPTTIGAYTTAVGGFDVFVTRLSLAPVGGASLVYSAYLGGSGDDSTGSAAVDGNGVVTVTGWTKSTNFPTTNGAYSRTSSGPNGGFVSQLDPRMTGAAQLIYSTYLGDSYIKRASVDVRGIITMIGETGSSTFPTTSGAFDRTMNGGSDTFVRRLDPQRTGAAQLVYSTFLGGTITDRPNALSVDSAGVITVAGYTDSADFPTTNGAFSRTRGAGFWDAFITRLDPQKVGTAQLVYSTFLGGLYGVNQAWAVSADDNGMITVAGRTVASNFPTTPGAFSRTIGSGLCGFVSRLDPQKSGTAQLVYSTFLSGDYHDSIWALAVDPEGVVTVVGSTDSHDFPTTPGALDTTFSFANASSYGFGDGFVSRLDPRKTGAAQLIYSTFLGGDQWDQARALSIEPSGVVTVVGETYSGDFPTTPGAFDTTRNSSGWSAFVTRLDMGVALHADRYRLPLSSGGTQTLTLSAGIAHANRSYWVVGSVSGTSPGVNVTGIHIPLNVDPYTDFTIASARPPTFVGFQGTLDSQGEATASIHVPALPALVSFTLHHAYFVFDNTGRIHMASNAVPLTSR